MRSTAAASSTVRKSGRPMANLRSPRPPSSQLVTARGDQPRHCRSPGQRDSSLLCRGRQTIASAPRNRVAGYDDIRETATGEGPCCRPRTSTGNANGKAAGMGGRGLPRRSPDDHSRSGSRMDSRSGGGRRPTRVAPRRLRADPVADRPASAFGHPVIRAQSTAAAARPTLRGRPGTLEQRLADVRRDRRRSRQELDADDRLALVDVDGYIVGDVHGATDRPIREREIPRSDLGVEVEPHRISR